MGSPGVVHTHTHLILMTTPPPAPRPEVPKFKRGHGLWVWSALPTQAWETGPLTKPRSPPECGS